MAEIEVGFHNEAREEYLGALQSYTTLSHELGRSFQEEVHHSIDLISAGPEQWPIFEDRIRFIRIRRFPF